jgi:D-alanine-D-alanine ligase
LAKRWIHSKGNVNLKKLLSHLDEIILKDKNASGNKTRVAVILGGYSSERHISVESGRNVFEKLSSSEKYAPFPVFLTGNSQNHELYHIPINLMLKDNADDIKEKAENFKVHPVIKNIMKQCKAITQKYASANAVSAPQKISYQDLQEKADEVFIALHGRPGEDGAVQEKLYSLRIPYNGSGRDSSSLTIDKYRTNEVLKTNGFLVADHILVTKQDWENNKSSVEKTLNDRIKYPFIAKPVDDGCSSAVKKIKTFAEFEAFCKLIFRTAEQLDPSAAQTLHIKPKEEFPQKQVILVEELISKKGAKHFLEITGGMLTKLNDKGETEYEVFEASEALADGDVLSLEEKFLAGQGQNITPARYAKDPAERQKISDQVKQTLGAAAKVLGVSGYCRIDAFVRVFDGPRVEVIFIEVNSLPGMTPATCIFHQAAINNYKPYEFIDKILEFGKQRVMQMAQ